MSAQMTRARRAAIFVVLIAGLPAIGSASPSEPDPAATFVDRDVVEMLALDRGRPYTTFQLDTPVRGLWRTALAYFRPPKLDPVDRNKLAALKARGFRYDVSLQMRDFGHHYYRLRVYRR